MISTRKRQVVPMGARVVGRLLLVAVFVGIAVVIRHSEQMEGRVFEDRFRLRVETAAPFLKAYIHDLLRRERVVAEQDLSDAVVDHASFERMVRVFGFEAAVLMDENGFLLSVFPKRPEMHGTYILDRYSHLREALSRGAAVSSVVASAADSSAITGFAVSYKAQSGTRVFSGAYDVTQAPLHAYMINMLPVRGASADLIDDHGVIVASNRKHSASRRDLAAVDPQLWAALWEQPAGACGGSDGDRLFMAQTIADSPWRLVAAVDQQTLYAPLATESRWLRWLLYSAFCGAAFVAAELLLRLAENSLKLRAMNEDLARLARMDRLTGLPNRLQLEEQLARLNSAVRRRQQTMSVMVIDVDHFKSVNDTYGHAAGDDVLRALAARMAGALRAEDMLGRWGGEEFLALLPNTEAEGARIVGERLRTAANAEPIEMSDGKLIRVTVSIGCATTVGPLDESVVNRADQAVYDAKTLGRDRVVSSVPPSVTWALDGLSDSL